MGYLSIPLTEKTQRLLTIVTPFSFFEKCILPMDVKPTTDIFLSTKVGIFCGYESKQTQSLHQGHFPLKRGRL
jgi:hypothetical protein